MKLNASVLLLFGASLASHAAITVTITPGVSGTIFSVSQTAANPLVSFDAVTGGYVAGIRLAPGAFDQATGALDLVDTFSPALGTFTDILGGNSGTITGFSFHFDNDSGLYRPSLELDSIFSLESNLSHQLELSNAASSEIAIDFSHFVSGTYVTVDTLFREITTIVIPEPGSILLLSIGSVFIFLRRRC